MRPLVQDSGSETVLVSQEGACKHCETLASLGREVSETAIPPRRSPATPALPRASAHIPHPFSQFRGLLAEPPAGGEGELCVDYCMPYKFLFLGYLFINHAFMQTGRPISDTP